MKWVIKTLHQSAKARQPLFYNEQPKLCGLSLTSHRPPAGLLQWSPSSDTDLPEVSSAVGSLSSLADLVALYRQQGWSLQLEDQQHLVPTDRPTSRKKKRNFSLGVAGKCCSQGCTKNDIGRLCWVRQGKEMCCVERHLGSPPDIWPHPSPLYKYICISFVSFVKEATLYCVSLSLWIHFQCSYEMWQCLIFLAELDE